MSAQPADRSAESARQPRPTGVITDEGVATLRARIGIAEPYPNQAHFRSPGTDAFRHAVPDAGDAGAVLFVNFDAGSWFDDVHELQPLEALGASVRVDDGTSHLVLRVTTD